MEPDANPDVAGDAGSYTLHYFPFSLYALMSRFAFVLGRSLNPETAPRLQLSLVNIHREENLTEKYLTEVNPRGQVPALTGPSLQSPIIDSRNIADWLCRLQPELMPPEHEKAIRCLLDKLYAFHAMGLVVPSDQRKEGIPNQAAAWLEKQDLSEPHRRALEIKSVFHDTTSSRALEPESVQLVEQQARDFTNSLAKVLAQRKRDGPWVFGSRPTILDAHATPMIARMADVKRDDLLPEVVREYGSAVRATDEWCEVTHGRPTTWDVSMGHAADLDPL